MVKKILSFVGREISGLHEAAYLLAASAAASLVFALVRDRLLAHILGASASLDVYYAAFRVPDLIYVTAASLVSTSILVPFLIEARERSREELKASIQNLFSAFAAIVLAVCVVAFFAMPWLDKLFFPELFIGGRGAELVLVSRILLLSPVLLGLSSFLASITQMNSRFMIYALSTPLYNIGIIIGIVCFLPFLGVAGIAWGVALGALLFAIVQVPVVIRDGLLPRPSLRFRWSRVKRVVLLSIPRTVTLSSQQLTELGLVSFASFLSVGSISIFNFAFNLQSVPLSIVGASYSSAAYPVLAKLLAQNEREAFVAKMVAAAKHIVFWSVPIMTLFIVLRAQIVRVILGSGRFDWSDTRLTAAALALFVASSFGQSLMLLFIRAFYAEGKTWKPLVINVVSTVVTVALAYCLLSLFHGWPMFARFTDALMKTTGAGDSSVLMLPLAFTLGTFMNLWLHWRSFSREYAGFSRPVFTTAWHSFAASIIGGFLAYMSLRAFDDVFGLSTTFGVFMQGLCAGIVGIVMIGVMLWILESAEFRDIHSAVRHRIWKVDRASLDKLPS